MDIIQEIMLVFGALIEKMRVIFLFVISQFLPVPEDDYVDTDEQHRHY